MTTATIATPVAPATEPTTPMKLSEAIRIGSLLTKPQRYSYMRWEGAKLYACALGAAAYVHGARDGDAVWRWACDRGIGRLDAECPACYRLPEPGVGTVQHLNDFHGWERPRIADWLEGIGL